MRRIENLHFLLVGSAVIVGLLFLMQRVDAISVVMDLMFEVNAQCIRTGSNNRSVLTEYLRDELGLKGTRFGCGQEQCGACVVLIDGEPRYSCTTDISQLAGCKVETIESLAQTREGGILLSYFEHFQAGQCGFCLSGIFVQALHFLRHSSDGSCEAIAKALEPHLCRCGAHRRIVSAVQASWNALQEVAT
jgi:nicotinate dehydrogenase subunit A